MPVIQAVNNNKNTFQNKNKKKRETPISHNKFTPNKFLHEWYSSPSQLRYPQLSYFRSNAILNWVLKTSS